MSMWDCLPPETAGWFELSVNGGSPVDVFVRRGRAAGPRTAVTSGIHGDEFEGPAAIADLVAALQQEEVLGTVMLIPIANPSAFRAASRTSPDDGKNLARTFPGDPGGSLTDRLAAVIFSALSGAEHLVDLHSGGVACEFLPVAGFYGEPTMANPCFSAAWRMNLGATWRLPATPGVLSYEMYLRGVVAVGCEFRGGGRLDPSGRQAYREGVLGLLQYWGHLPERSASPTTLPAGLEGDWILASADGLFESPLMPGDLIVSGTEAARICGPRGEIRQSLKADRDGCVLGVRSLASIRRGDWAILIGGKLEVSGG